MRLVSFAAVSAALVLAACGGGTSGSGTTPDLSAEATFGELRNDFARLDAANRLAVTPPELVPSTGGATFRGAAVFSDTSTAPSVIISAPSSASQVEITTNFATSQFGGRLFNFRNADPAVPMDGQLDLSGVVTGNVLLGGVSGSLDVNGIARDHSGGQLVGNFLGNDARAMDGQILQGTSPTPYNGIFIAER